MLWSRETKGTRYVTNLDLQLGSPAARQMTDTVDVATVSKYHVRSLNC